MTEPSGPTTPEEPATFDVLPLGADLRKAIDAMGYKHPTPVQRAVFEPAARGRSLVVQARTGTGKTAAFGLPILDQLVRRSTPKVQALILTPTRELAIQVSNELERLAQFRGVHIACIYGGAPMGKQIDALEAGAQVVVGTPGRVLDHLRRGTLDPSQVRILVLDEADEMLSMGFAKELHAICDTLPKDRQGLFFSATIPPDMERLAQSQLRDPEFVTLSSDQVGALEISHFVYVMRGTENKRQQLIRILEVEDPESAIIFCNTKDETEGLAEALKNQGFDADFLMGDLDQRERERVMTRTREGKLRFLVATDVAARGIDISHLTHVINADFPEAAESYVHRTGRTGRAGRTGTAISLVGPKDIGNLYLLRLTYKIRPIEKQLPTAGELKTRAEHDLVQLFLDAFGTREVHPDDLALARRLLTHADAEKIVAGLIRDHLGARPVEATAEAAAARRARNPPLAPSVSAPPEATATKPARAARTHEARPVEAARAPAERPAGRPPREAEGSRDDGPPPGAAEPPAARARDAADATDKRSPRGPVRERRATDTRRERSRDRVGVPHKSFTNWEPPTENDDDQPILPEGRRRRETPDTAPTQIPEPPAPPAGDVEAAAPPEAAVASEDADFAQVFVNVGRRDGARAADLQALLEAGGALQGGEIGRIRVRDRMTFVSVQRAAVDRAITALSGQVVGNRTVSAEPAKSRGRGDDEPRENGG